MNNSYVEKSFDLLIKQNVNLLLNISLVPSLQITAVLFVANNWKYMYKTIIFEFFFID